MPDAQRAAQNRVYLGFAQRLQPLMRRQIGLDPTQSAGRTCRSTPSELILGPIFTDIPFAAGKGSATTGVAEIIEGLRMTIAVNALGLPAVALPVGVENGLPQAVQLIGPPYREDSDPALRRALMACAGMLVAGVEQEPGESASNRQSCSRASVSWPPDSA